MLNFNVFKSLSFSHLSPHTYPPPPSSSLSPFFLSLLQSSLSHLVPPLPPPPHSSSLLLSVSLNLSQVMRKRWCHWLSDCWRQHETNRFCCTQTWSGIALSLSLCTPLTHSGPLSLWAPLSLSLWASLSLSPLGVYKGSKTNKLQT